MDILAGKYIRLVIVVLACQMIGYSQDVRSDFAGALERAQAELPDNPRRVFYYDLQQEADRYVSEHAAPEALGFLQERIADPESRKLALLILAKFAVMNATAESVFRSQLVGNDAREATIAISYLPRDEGRRMAESIVQGEYPWEVRIAGVGMLAGLGDEDTLQMLRQSGQIETRPAIKETIERAIASLEYRLTNVPVARQLEWATQEAICWRTTRELPIPRSLTGVYADAADVLHERGIVFSRDFLEHRLQTQDLLGIAAVGQQREIWAVVQLAENADRTDVVGEFARNALGEMGTNECVRALERVIANGGSNRGTRSHVLGLLMSCGDEETVQYLLDLSANTSLTDDERALFRRVAQGIGRLLERRGP